MRLRFRWFRDFEGFASHDWCFAIVAHRLVFGVEADRGALGNPWVVLYLGWRGFEIYLDRDGSWAL